MNIGFKILEAWPIDARGQSGENPPHEYFL